jgi:hypothetical protein
VPQVRLAGAMGARSSLKRDGSGAVFGLRNGMEVIVRRNDADVSGCKRRNDRATQYPPNEAADLYGRPMACDSALPLQVGLKQTFRANKRLKQNGLTLKRAYCVPNIPGCREAVRDIATQRYCNPRWVSVTQSNFRTTCMGGLAGNDNPAYN